MINLKSISALYLYRDEQETKPGYVAVATAVREYLSLKWGNSLSGVGGYLRSSGFKVGRTDELISVIEHCGFTVEQDGNKRVVKVVDHE